MRLSLDEAEACSEKREKASLISDSSAAVMLFSLASLEGRAFFSVDGVV